MEVIITLYGATIGRANNMKFLPRIGESMKLCKTLYKVKNVVWHIDTGSYVYVEIVVDYMNN